MNETEAKLREFLDKFIEELKENPLKTGVKLFAFVVIARWLYNFLFKDENR